MYSYREKLKKYTTYAIILMPILGTYGFLSKSITIADLMIMISLFGIFFYFLINHKVKLSSNSFLIFSIWVFISTILASVLGNDLFSSITILQLIKFFVYSLLILAVPTEFFDRKKAEEIYTRIAIVLSIIVFIQLAIYLITGTFKPWVINNSYFPPIFVNDDYFSSGYLYMLGGNSFRPSSIFTEPALFAQYVSPCLILNMFKENSKKKYIILITITAATILGKSANGIIYVAIIWLFYLYFMLVKKIKSKNRKINIGFVLMILGMSLILPLSFTKIKDFLVGDNQYSIKQRIGEIFDESGETSGSMRVVRGWKIFNALTMSEKTIGIGNGNIINYLNSHYGIVTMFKESYNGYMSGLSAIFVNFGIIGGILYLSWWITEFKKKNPILKSLLMFLLLYLIASNSFLTPQFIVTTILIISMGKVKNKKNMIAGDKIE